MEKATLGFCIYKIWQILKRFAGTFRQAQTLKLGGVITECLLIHMMGARNSLSFALYDL